MRVADVPGLLAVRLNGERLTMPVADTSSYEWEIDPGLPEKNLLILELDPRGVGPDPWGAIALVISS